MRKIKIRREGRGHGTHPRLADAAPLARLGWGLLFLGAASTAAYWSSSVGARSIGAVLDVIGSRLGISERGTPRLSFCPSHDETRELVDSLDECRNP